MEGPAVDVEIVEPASSKPRSYLAPELRYAAAGEHHGQVMLMLVCPHVL